MDAELDAVETASKKKVHKTDEFFGNKSADAVLNSANDKIEKREPLEQIIIPLQERDKILNKSKTSIIIKMKHYKISNLL